jgi:hypothetical protein
MQKKGKEEEEEERWLWFEAVGGGALSCIWKFLHFCVSYLGETDTKR